MQYFAAANQIAREGRSEACSDQAFAQLTVGLFAMEIFLETAEQAQVGVCGKLMF